ncbi:dihydrofolate reductase [Erysipelothrix sp. HDW6C]|uniref:dihydrofolate reductase family protein n=1 Tax=Erysipelothrix sp. HDW6C TaxID=2714930 RepID=UPI00140C6483|nr:dihydrofolate reductase family protein [Erysipelothrix sp. HDW6C]QIK69217.1 dihydrofolate reductase [Erysipelothrix sp. HDW6C]
MKLYFYGCITMDGYLADKNHQLDWLHDSGSVEETSYDSFYKEMNVTIMGRRTYDAIKDIPNISDFYSTTENYVFTHQSEALIDRFTPISGDVIRFIDTFKSENIWIVGGNTILSHLLNANRVDEIILQIAPVLLGSGIPLFTQEDAIKRFTLKSVHQFGQFAEMRYTRFQ